VVAREPHLLDVDWLTAGTPHAHYAELRRREPVSWQEAESGGYWSVLKHADVLAVSRDPALFSAERKGMQLVDYTDQLPTLLSLDPPRHSEMRRRVLHAFTPKVVRELEPRMRAIVRATFDRVAERETCDFVQDVVRPLPLEIVCDILGVPHEDRARVGDWADLLAGSADPEIAREGKTGTQGAIEFGTYAFQLAQKHEPAHGESLIAVLKNAELDGEQVDRITFCGLFVQIAIAGNETTRSTLVGGVLELIRNPDALRALQSDPAKIPGAVEEMLRFLSPVHYFRRTATRDTVLRGQKIAAGDRVVMMYASANRDEDVFRDPDRFDVERSPNPHVAFGNGPHFCLGAALGRLEARVFLEELFARFATIELAGEPVRLRSNELNAWKRMPVRLIRR
jgi:cytochrome P450